MCPDSKEEDIATPFFPSQIESMFLQPGLTCVSTIQGGFHIHICVLFSFPLEIASYKNVHPLSLLNKPLFWKQFVVLGGFPKIETNLKCVRVLTQRSITFYP